MRRRTNRPETGVIWLPTAAQDLLLRASFLPSRTGLDAWEEWKSTVDLDDHLDLGSLRLLPYVWRRLRGEGVRDPLFMRLAGVSRKHWLENRLFFRELAGLVQSLREHDVGVLVPTGTALALQHYPDYVLDPPIDSAVVVRSTQARRAFERIQAVGWTPCPHVAEAVLEDYLSARSWHPFQKGDGRQLRLQWHVVPERANDRVDGDFWSAARTVRHSDMTVAVLNPADQLVHACAQSVSASVRPTFLRSVDAMLLLSASGNAIDWDGFVRSAAEPGLRMAVLDTLSYLQDRLDGPIPSAVLRALQAVPISGRERLEFKLRSRRPGWLGRAAVLWFNYRRAEDTNLIESVVRFPRFLQHYFRLNHLWQTPFYAIAKTASRVRRLAM